MAQNFARLVVVVPSLKGEVSAWASLVDQLKTLQAYGDDVCLWEFMPHGAHWNRGGRAMDLAAQLEAKIHQRWEANGGFEDIVVVGHSLGGLLVRQAYLLGLGATGGRASHPWAAKVTRIILFASMNRGVEISRRRAWWMPILAWAARVLPGTKKWLVHDLVQGSTFITNMRISWIREINAMTQPPLVVQFRGNSDRLVGEGDSRDINVFESGHETLIPDASHSDLIRLDTAPEPMARFALVRRAFVEEVPRQAPQETGDPAKTVVIVLHGIRAGNTTWVRDISDRLERDWPGVRAVPATYGRFSARKFVIPVTRRKFLRWMQDTYAEELAENPRATFHFIGHSNGTYLLGRSLEQIENMRFTRVVLAGSVLEDGYDWHSRVALGQVGSLRNHRAAKDVPVAMLCRGLRAVGMRDIGTGGVDGFNDTDPAKTEVYYYRGGHSAALTAANLPHLASFVMDGQMTTPTDLAQGPSKVFALMSRAAPAVTVLFLLAALGGAAAFVLNGPWGHVSNGLTLAGVLVTLFVVLDIA